MNCEQEQKWILLAETGELTPRATAALSAHLDVCSGCRGFRDELRRFDDVARLQQASVTMPAFLCAHVLADAEQYRQVRRIHHLRAMRWLARAAAVAILMGAAGGAGLYEHWQRQANRIDEVAGVLTMLSDEEGVGRLTTPADRNSLAGDLLLLEGFDEDLSGAELLNLADEA